MAVAARDLIGTDKAKRFWEATAQLMLWNHSSSIFDTTRYSINYQICEYWVVESPWTAQGPEMIESWQPME